MADASRHSPPPGWGDAFAALPLEPPTTSQWPLILSRLQARDGRATPPTRNRTWLALAASLFALALVPLVWIAFENVATDTTDRPGASISTAAQPRPRAPAAATKVSTDVKIDVSSARNVDSPTAAALAPPREQAPTRAGSDAKRRAQIAGNVAMQKARQPQVRVASPSPHAGLDEASGLQASFESLYADAAQLEQFLSIARDTRVASGPVASLAGALDADLAIVDARLAEPDIDVDQRLALWQKRVALLRESAIFESQLRLLAVDGRRLDGAVAEVH